ncbi:UNKNOWN [Stylonychia lemnae]|uniref:Uncharacterized protein n=1 Tax=Stylonychia lemnae TaxID=5949 RepID=A0A078AKU6_STYLE|nr:UNKNOWN [Stylonychia lemnae]|eukprot:CDW82995.1 UNKNOWN [Stylonychia lemnae]
MFTSSDDSDVQDKKEVFSMFAKQHESTKRRFSTARMTLQYSSYSYDPDSDSSSSKSEPPSNKSPSNEHSHQFSEYQQIKELFSDNQNNKLKMLGERLNAKISQLQNLNSNKKSKRLVIGNRFSPKNESKLHQHQFRKQLNLSLDEMELASDHEDQSQGSVLMIDTNTYRKQLDSDIELQDQKQEVRLTDKKVKKFKTQSERLKMDVVYKFLFRKIKKVILKSFYDSCKLGQSSSRKQKQNIRKDKTTKLKEQMIKFLEQSWIQEPTKDVLCCLGLMLYPNFNTKNFKFLSEAGLYPGMELKEEVCIAFSKIYRENNKKIRDTLFNHKFFREFVWPLFIKEVPSFDDVINAGEYKKYKNSVDHMFYQLDKVYDLVFPFKPNFFKEVMVEQKQDNPEEGQIGMEN